MQQHVRIVGWLFIVYSAIILLLAVGLFFVITGAGFISGEREAMLVTGAVGTGLAVFLALVALPGLITGFGLLKFREWARIVGIVLSILHLVGFPFGTALGIYSLWVLLNAQTAPLFASPAGSNVPTSV